MNIRKAIILSAFFIAGYMQFVSGAQKLPTLSDVIDTQKLQPKPGLTVSKDINGNVNGAMVSQLDSGMFQLQTYVKDGATGLSGVSTCLLDASGNTIGNNTYQIPLSEPLWVTLALTPPTTTPAAIDLRQIFIPNYTYGDNGICESWGNGCDDGLLHLGQAELDSHATKYNNQFPPNQNNNRNRAKSSTKATEQKKTSEAIPIIQPSNENPIQDIPPQVTVEPLPNRSEEARKAMGKIAHQRQMERDGDAAENAANTENLMRGINQQSYQETHARLDRQQISNVDKAWESTSVDSLPPGVFEQYLGQLSDEELLSKTYLYTNPRILFYMSQRPGYKEHITELNRKITAPSSQARDLRDRINNAPTIGNQTITVSNIVACEARMSNYANSGETPQHFLETVDKQMYRHPTFKAFIVKTMPREAAKFFSDLAYKLSNDDGFQKAVIPETEGYDYKQEGRDAITIPLIGKIHHGPSRYPYSELRDTVNNITTGLNKQVEALNSAHQQAVSSSSNTTTTATSTSTTSSTNSTEPKSDMRSNQSRGEKRKADGDPTTTQAPDLKKTRLDLERKSVQQRFLAELDRKEKLQEPEKTATEQFLESTKEIVKDVAVDGLKTGCHQAVHYIADKGVDKAIRAYHGVDQWSSATPTRYTAHLFQDQPSSHYISPSTPAIIFDTAPRLINSTATPSRLSSSTSSVSTNIGMDGSTVTGNNGQQINLGQIKYKIAATELLAHKLAQKAHDKPRVIEMGKAIDAFNQLAQNFATAGDEDSALLLSNIARHHLVIAQDLLKDLTNASTNAIPSGLGRLASREHWTGMATSMVETGFKMAYAIEEFNEVGDSLDMARLQALDQRYHTQAEATKAMVRNHIAVLKGMSREQLLERGIEEGIVFIGDFFACKSVGLLAKGALSIANAGDIQSSVTQLQNVLRTADPLTKQHVAEIVGFGKIALEHGPEISEEALALFKETPELLVQEGKAVGQAVGETAKKLNEANIRGKVFENFLVEKLGGKGSFKVTSRISGTREFDGAFGDIWYEAKSGEYWNMITSNERLQGKFQSDMIKGLNIARENGAHYELYSNSPIPQNVKDWLTKKGISFTEWT